jgi:hypothetical protein
MHAAAKWVGADEARRLVLDRPMAMLENRAPGDAAPEPVHDPAGRKPRSRGLWAKLTGRRARF